MFMVATDKIEFSLVLRKVMAAKWLIDAIFFAHFCAKYLCERHKRKASQGQAWDVFPKPL